MRRHQFLLGLIAISTIVAGHVQGQLVYNITTLADTEHPSTPGSFRAALEYANRNMRLATPQNRIMLVFAAGLANGTIRLAATPPPLYSSWTTLTVAGTDPARRVTVECTNANAALLCSGDGIVLEHMRFSYGGNVTGHGDTVMFIGCQGGRMSRCDVVEGYEFGFTLVGSRNAVIEDCLFENNGKPSGGGLLAQDGCDDLTIERCTWRNHQEGCGGFASISNVAFRDCRFENNASGFFFAEVCRNVTWERNEAINNRGTMLNMELPVGLRVLDSNFSGNGYVTRGAQITLFDGIDVEIARTRIENGGGVGLVALRMLRLKLDRVTITGQGFTGLQLEQDCALLQMSDTTIVNNSRQGNSPQAMITGLGGGDLRRNWFAQGPGTGLLLRDSQGVTLSDDNLFEDLGGTGVHVVGGRDNAIGPRDPNAANDGGNTFRRLTGTAVLLEGATNTSVCGGIATPKNSVFQQVGMGVSVIGASSGCVIGPGNTIQSGHIGIHVRQPARDTFVTGNYVTGYATSGLMLDHVDGAEVLRSVFVGHPGSASGLEILNSQRVRLLGNLSRDNGGAGFHVVECPNAFMGPGNVAWQNQLSGFYLESAVRAPITAQSCVAFGQTSNNSFGFLCLGVDATLVNCTSARNWAGFSAQRNSRSAVSNSILWGNLQYDRHSSSATVTMTRSIYDPARSIGGTFTDAENLTSSATNFPRFADLLNGDLHLLPSSPAIDAGSNVPFGGLPSGDSDFETRVRRGGGGDMVDIGADEATLAAAALGIEGGPIRTRVDNVFTYPLDLGAQRAFAPYVLLISFGGTSPGIQIAGNVRLAMNPDNFTFWSMQSPTMFGFADQNGTGQHQLVVPPELMPLLPAELTAACVALSTPLFATNPVVVRFIQ